MNQKFLFFTQNLSRVILSSCILIIIELFKVSLVYWRIDKLRSPLIYLRWGNLKTNVRNSKKSDIRNTVLVRKEEGPYFLHLFFFELCVVVFYTPLENFCVDGISLIRLHEKKVRIKRIDVGRTCLDFTFGHIVILDVWMHL